MDPVLTAEQMQALQTRPGGPVRVIDPRTQQAYVLVRADHYEQLLTVLNDEYHLSDTYPAQAQSAMRAGWSDPAMDEYNDYEENLKKLCR
jgi:hypothetical protein